MKNRTAMCFLGASLVAATASAVPIARAGIWDEETRMLLVKVLVGEAGYEEVADHPAILGVLEKRHALPAWRSKGIGELAQAYSAVVREGLPTNANRERAARVTRDSAPEAVMELVDALGDGTPLVPCRRAWEPGMVCDPCRGRAVHWGSVHDSRDSPLPTVSCGRTLNVFLGERQQVSLRLRSFPVTGVIPAREAH